MKRLSVLLVTTLLGCEAVLESRSPRDMGPRNPDARTPDAFVPPGVDGGFSGIDAGTTCTASCAGLECGEDGCGGSCGTCVSGASCVGGRCAMCVPMTCAALPTACGVMSDGCGGTVDCTRPCSAGESCRGGVCQAAVACTPASCPAFPGAEGYGWDAEGGRGGDVYHVTSLSNSGSGSLREGLSRGNRTIVFDVGGIIDLTATLNARVGNVTIAGQTAPGDGITVRGYDVNLRGDNNIVQHIRFRAGDIRKKTASRDGFTEDSFNIGGRHNIVDHVSASWGIDECLSAAYTGWDYLTVQHSFITEGLMRTRLFHGEVDADHPGHSMGGLYVSNDGDTHVTLHHNLYAHNNSRNPGIGSKGRSQWADIRNNILYNAGGTIGYANSDTTLDTMAIHLNYVGNYGIMGASSTADVLFDCDTEDHVRAFASGNFFDANRNGRLDGSSSSALDGPHARVPEYVMPPVFTESAPDAFIHVLDNAGARPWNRDSVDVRIVDSVRRQTGRIIDSQNDVGGWGTVAAGTRVVDGDRDGMPDAYERMVGTNPSAADNNADANGDGYTNLENYLHFASRLVR